MCKLAGVGGGQHQVGVAYNLVAPHPKRSRPSLVVPGPQIPRPWEIQAKSATMELSEKYRDALFDVCLSQKAKDALFVAR